MTYAEYIKHELKMWSETIIPQVLLEVDSDIKCVLDIGPSFGASLISLRKYNATIELIGIEKNWSKIKETKLSPSGYSQSFYDDLKIDILELNGNDPSVPYHRADLIIKTFNDAVSWDHIIGKTEAKYILASTVSFDVIDKSKFEPIKDILAEPNSYRLYRRL